MKRLLLILLSLVVIIFASLFVFIVGNNAPIINGRIDYDIEYKEDLCLDVYYPLTNIHERVPVVVYFHGGGWLAGRKEALNMNRFNAAFNRMREHGYMIVSVDYTLASEGKSPFPDCILDAYDALNWIVEKSNEFSIDTNNVGLFGESAGAHMAMMMAYCPDGFLGSDLQLKKINYVVDIYGPTYLEGMLESEAMLGMKKMLNWTPDFLKDDFDIAKKIFGFDPESEPWLADSLMNAYSPINYVSEKCPPTLLIHGKLDHLVPIDQSVALQKKLDAVGVFHETHLLEEVNHNLSGASDEQKERAQNWVVDFIRKYYNSP